MTQPAGCTVPLCFPSIVWDRHGSKCVIRSTPTQSPSPSTRQSLLRPSCMHSFLNPESAKRCLPTWLQGHPLERASVAFPIATIWRQSSCCLLLHHIPSCTALSPPLTMKHAPHVELYSRTTLLMLPQPTMASAANTPMSFLHV